MKYWLEMIVAFLWWFIKTPFLEVTFFVKGFLKSLYFPKVWIYFFFINFVVQSFFLKNDRSLLNLVFLIVAIVWYLVEKGEWKGEWRKRKKERLLGRVKCN